VEAVAASIIHLRLKTEDRAKISIMCFLLICEIAPIVAEVAINMKMIFIVVNMIR